MSENPDSQALPLIGFITRDNAPQISPAPISRAWMSEMRGGWPNRCLPMLIANQSGWELRNPSAFTATWIGREDRMDVMIVPDKRDPDQFLPRGDFGNGILTWHLPMLFRTPAGFNLLVRGPANYPKDAISPLEKISSPPPAPRSLATPPGKSATPPIPISSAAASPSANTQR